MLIFDKTALTFCRGFIGFSFKAYRNSFSQSALLGAVCISPKLELWTLRSEIYVSRSFSLMSGMGVNLWFGLLKMTLAMRASVLLWLLLLPKWCLLFVFGKEKMALGRGHQRLPPLRQCFGECIEFLTHSGILATHILPRMLFTGSSFGFWDCLHQSHFHARLFVCLPSCQLNCSRVAVPFAILSLTLKFWLIYENVQFLKFDSVFKIVLSNVVMETDCAKA